MFRRSSSSSSSEDEYVVYRRRKVYRERKDCLTSYDEKEFFYRFRSTKNTVLGGCIQPLQQLLLTLRYYASGNMQIDVADFMGVSKASACRIIRRISTAIVFLSPRYISMYDNNMDMERAAEKFYGMARFPRVIGAIDCTLIKIDSPGGDDAGIFKSRKGFFALNVQTVSDAKLKIRDIVARWPGATHDQTIFNNSNLKRKFEAGNFGKYILVGDSGYSLQTTRNVVEREYGVWKRRFPVLWVGMRQNVEHVMEIIIATAVLHNSAIDMNDLYPEEELENVEDHQEKGGNEENVINNARQYRQLLTNEHFARL
ncbi:DDE superfamily endonuclease [Popillia japonica]|uniref:DDE superfamily endonuclease n=1 Tax=Popillia japonica TaxID=7064 RepID=A0AAW1JCM7_POPJA